MANDTIKPMNYDPKERPRRQEYPLEWLENGSIYVFRPDVLKQYGLRMGGKIVIYPMNALTSLQIDSLDDLELVERVMQFN